MAGIPSGKCAGKSRPCSPKKTDFMKTKKLRPVPLLLPGLLLTVALTGCHTVPVQPWERATLADYTMRPDRDPLATTANEHVFFSRESAAGGRGVGGSGCGCN